jgi:alkyl sulfatase BDS1-like metallo-beta-lactamase superfamily hydrolase
VLQLLGDVPVAIEHRTLRFDVPRLDVRLGDLGRGDADQPDATIETDPDTLDAVLWKDRPLADAQRSGTMTIEGDQAAVERLLPLFPTPDPAAAVSPA